MTDSSDDSSDDGLLASPVFKKRDRRSERADRNKLDFLASCVAGSDARADVHRRIQEVDEEMRREEEEEENGRSESGKEGDDGDAEMEEAGAVPGGDAATNEDNDGGAPKEEGKENSEINATAPETAAEAKSEEPSTVDCKSSTATTAAKTNKQREEDYWSRVDSFAGALKPPGTNVYDPHEARSKLEDGVSGLVDYNSDMTDDEGGNWRDGAGGMTREQLRQEADARSRGMSSSLGLRPMFRPKSAVEMGEEGRGSVKKEENGGIMRAFQTTEEALAELKSVVASLKRTHRTLGGPLLQPLNKVLRKPKGDVWDLLAKELCTNKVLKGRYAVRLPEVFCKWLWRMALSSVDAACTECQKLVRKYIVMEADAPNENSQPSFGVEMDFLQELGMLDVVSCLEDDFGLWLGDGPMPSPSKKEAGDENGVTPKEGEDASLNLKALRNVFLLWIALLRRNLIRVRGNVGDVSSAIGDDASRALVALTRVGLDPLMHLADENQKSAFEPLPRLLESLTTSLVRSATQQIREQSGDVHVHQWTKRSARLMAEACIDLGAGADEAADADDRDGILPLATAVKQMTCELVAKEDDDFSTEVALLKLAFAGRALRECLDEVSDWEGQMKERKDPLTENWKKEEGSESSSLAKERLQYALQAMVTAEVGFGHIDKEKQAFLSDHAHLLAAVNITGECALIGLSIFHRTQNDDTSEESVYATEEKDAVYEVASNVEDLCDGIRKECRAVIAHPHLRRTKEYLTRLGKWLGGTKGKSSQGRKKKRQQGSLDCYFMSQGIGDSQDMSQSQDVDDSQDVSQDM
ncbi:hypothetical protein ACHAXT_007338 [Thalassiosira profunda]